MEPRETQRETHGETPRQHWATLPASRFAIDRALMQGSAGRRCGPPPWAAGRARCPIHPQTLVARGERARPRPMITASFARRARFVPSVCVWGAVTHSVDKLTNNPPHPPPSTEHVGRRVFPGMCLLHAHRCTHTAKARTTNAQRSTYRGPRGLIARPDSHTHTDTHGTNTAARGRGSGYNCPPPGSSLVHGPLAVPSCAGSSICTTRRT